MTTWLDAYKEGDPAWKEMQAASVVPGWMLRLSAEYDIAVELLQVTDARDWLPRVRGQCPVGAYIQVDGIAEGIDVDGTIVMNTASFLAVEQSDDVTWAIEWALIREAEVYVRD